MTLTVQLAQWFLRRRLKCEMLTDGRKVMTIAHMAFRPGELKNILNYDSRPSTFHILIFSSETTGPIAAKLWWNGPWMAPFQIVSGDPNFQPRWPPS
jgi:hypothetical protein